MTRHFHILKVLFFLSAFLPLFPSNVHAASQTTEVIEQFHKVLLAVMKEATSLGLKGRYERLEPEIVKAHDLRLMVRASAGGFWKKATPQQQETLFQAFKRLSVSTYASQFDGYSGESFETINEKPGPQKTILVETRILRPEKDSVGITYVMRKRNNAWRIVDVLLDNSISELAVRRSEYRMILKKNGIDGLVSTLNKKADALVAK